MTPSHLSHAARTVLTHHRGLPDNEPKYASVLVGTAPDIQSYQDLDQAYVELENADLVQTAGTVDLFHPEMEGRHIKSRFQCRR